MTCLLEFDPSDIIQEIVELTQDKKFLDQIEIFLNQDEEILKTVKCTPKSNGLMKNT